jgi:glycerol uptake facilitator-like aquaporin
MCFASNGYGAHSPGGYSLAAALVIEVVMTMFFLLVILGATDRLSELGSERSPTGSSPARKTEGAEARTAQLVLGHAP